MRGWGVGACMGNEWMIGGCMGTSMCLEGLCVCRKGLPVSVSCTYECVFRVYVCVCISVSFKIHYLEALHRTWVVAQ